MIYSDFTGVRSADVPLYWPLVKDLIQSALDRGHDEYTIDDVLNGLLSKDFQLWAEIVNGAAKMAVITTITVYPKAKHLVILAAAGSDPESWRDSFDVVEAWGKSLSCTHIVVYARRGLEKVLSPWGLKPRQVVLSKKITGVENVQ